jgi:hypothetical protein
MEASMKWILRVLLVALVLAANGCAQGCDAILKTGILVTIVDGATGQPIVEEVTVIATEGSYSQTVMAVQGVAALAHERPGTYRVEVQAAGYQPWVMPSVGVTRDGCHVETVQLTALLTRTGAG